MPGGRPTKDPKGTLVAVRLSKRQRAALERRMRRDGVGLSEALRRCLDEWEARSRSTPSSRAPTPDEQASFDQAFAALGLTRRRRVRR